MTNEKESTEASCKQTVYYDGSCPMCTRLMKTIDTSSKGQEFSLKDIKTDTLPPTFTQKAVEKEIHVVGKDGTVYKNAEAILKIMETYPRWRFLARLGQLPGIRYFVLPLGYHFISTNRHFLFGTASRVYLLKLVVLVSFLTSLLISSKLWGTDRLYPLTPIIDNFSSTPPIVSTLLLALLIGSLVGSIFSARPKVFLWLTILSTAALFSLDQARLQPWAYQYVFMLMALSLFSWKYDDEKGKNLTLDLCRFIVASIYFWSGLQKANPFFVNDIFLWMSTPLMESLQLISESVFRMIGYAVPYIEMAIGIGLYLKKFRATAIGLAVAMGVFVLWALGPIGLGFNAVVWPWNIAMLLFVFILFPRKETLSVATLFQSSSLFPKIALLTFGFLPVLSLWNIWDAYPSWSLYSGTINVAHISMEKQTYRALPDILQKYTIPDEKKSLLSVTRWSYEELKVPPYPEARVLKNVGRSLCQSLGNPKDMALHLQGRWSWFFADKPETFSCAELSSSHP